ncbi:acetoacetate--CoA ligase [Actinospongicola halichondriae]|uniref:acetoacetate--CoA ligase n=1 Tax=Actinospongicola halichondriae TaxID=3236844 RepID=UPI003D4F08AC
MTGERETPLWTPSPERAELTRMAGLMARFGVDDYPALHRASVDEPERFWGALWDECGLVGDRGERVLDPGASMPEARFFPDARLSIVEHVVRHTGAEPAIVAVDEQGTTTISWDDLAIEVGAMAAALAADGVSEGDRVAIWLPNGIEAVVAMLGAAALGAVFSSTSPDFGAAGVLDRFGQIEPTVLFAVDGYDYGGKHFDRRDVKAEIVAGLPTLARTVTIGDDYDAYLRPHRGTPVPIERRPFDHPWYVLFSSGTTGKPKCIVHATGRVLLQHAKEHQFHCDLAAGDRLLYVTTCGWMMWNWLVSALASGVTIVCVDGNVVHPSPARLWDLVDEHGVDFLGVGAKYLDALANQGYSPMANHDLTSLKTLASTGSPLSPERFAWVYDEVKADVHLASISGGTDLCGCFVLGDPTSSVHAGEIQRPGLGMAVNVWSDGGEAQPPGVRGELVCTQPFPSQPIEFWDDPGGARYRAAYYERFPGVWHHGDFASWTERGGMLIHGRSDTTLNPGGIRIGTAEIYRVVEQLDGIAEALVFGQEVPDAGGGADDVRIVLLVVLDAGVTLDDDLRSAIASAVRSGCSPRHVPRLIVAVDELPRTRSGKLVEIAVGDVVNGRTVRNTEALANPEALWAIRDHPGLEL